MLTVFSLQDCKLTVPELRDEIQALKDEKCYLQVSLSLCLSRVTRLNPGNISGSKGISARSTGELSGQKLPAGVRSDRPGIRVGK